MPEHRFKVGEIVVMKGSQQSGVVHNRLVNLDTEELVYTVRHQFDFSGPVISEVLIRSYEEHLEWAEGEKQGMDDRETERFRKQNEERMKARKEQKEESHV